MSEIITTCIDEDQFQLIAYKGIAMSKNANQSLYQSEFFLNSFILTRRGWVSTFYKSRN